MVTARVGFNQLQYHYERQVIALDGSGNASIAVVFDAAYDNTPIVTVVPPLGVNGTWSAASITTTGFTISVVTASDLASSNAAMVWFAHQKM